MSFKKKILISQFYHESNSFAPGLTHEEEFMFALRDEMDLISEDSQNTIGAFAKKGKEYGWEIIPVLDAGCIPSGEIEKSLYEKIKAEIINGIRANLPLDGVLLSLHGAALAEGYDDTDGDLLAAVRKEVGPDIPVIVTLDKHANVSELMVDSADILLAFNNEPHTDPYERGLEAGDLLKQMFDGKIEPVAVRVRPPMLLPAINGCTDEDPMKTIMDTAYTFEENPEVIDVSVLIGFYGSDKADAGPCVITTTNKNRELAASVSKQVAQTMWQKKEDFFIDLVSVDEAIDKVQSQGGQWVFIDESDDPFGGASGDNVEILRKLITRGIHSAIISPIADPEVLAKAIDAGIGGTICVMLGGKAAPEYGGPVKIDAVVRKLHDKPIKMSEWDEDSASVGTIAVLDVDGIYILVTEFKIGAESVNIFREVGLDFTNYRIAVIKGLGNSIQKAYGDAPSGYIEIDGKGCTNPDVTKLGTFKKLSMELYPFNPDAVFHI